MAKKIIMVGSGYIANSFIANNFHNYQFYISSRKEKTYKNLPYLGDLFSPESNFDKLNADILIFSLSASSFRNTSLEDVASFIESFEIFLYKFKKSNIRKIIFLSSSSVYGLSGSRSKFYESQELLDDTAYRIEKIKSEKLIASILNNKKDKSYMILRLSNPYGLFDHMSKNGVINKCFLSLNSGQPVTINNSGKSFRDYIYIVDLVNFIKQAVDIDVKNKTFNIGSGEASSLFKVVTILQKQTDKFKFNLEESIYDVEDFSVLDISRAKKQLLYDPKFTLVNGITDFYQRYINQNTSIN